MALKPGRVYRSAALQPAQHDLHPADVRPAAGGGRRRAAADAAAAAPVRPAQHRSRSDDDADAGGAGRDDEGVHVRDARGGGAGADGGAPRTVEGLLS